MKQFHVVLNPQVSFMMVRNPDFFFLNFKVVTLSEIYCNLSLNIIVRTCSAPTQACIRQVGF